jgi:hypothetical protein
MLQFTFGKALLAAADVEVAAPVATVDEPIWELDVDGAANGDITYQAISVQVLNGMLKI